MSKEMTWQEKMELANQELDKLEAGASDETNVEDSQANLNPDTTETTPPNPTEDLVDIDSLVPKADPVPPAPNGDLAALQRQIADLQAELQRNKSENGRAHALSEKIKQIEAENQSLRERLSEANREQPLEGRRVDEFTQEEQDLMSEEMRAVLGGRFASLQKQNEAFAEEQRKIKEQLERANRLAEESERQAMRKLLSTQFPNLSAIAGSDAWKKFCAETDPITRQTYGSLFTNAYQHCDTDAVSAIIRHFISVSGMTDGRKTVGNKPEEHFLNDGGTTNPTRNVTYKLSEVQAFLTAAYSGRVNLQNEANAQLYREYSAAMEEGRVETD